MTIPRKHRDLMIQFANDPEAKVWVWVESIKKWETVNCPIWSKELVYHVGEEPPAEPPRKMCMLAGVEFPQPENEALKFDSVYFCCTTWGELYGSCLWKGDKTDQNLLKSGLIFKSQYAAEMASLAIRSAYKQAIDAARGEA